MLHTISETQAGLPKGSVQAFLSVLQKNKVNLHSLILLKGNDIFFEKYAEYFPAEFKHRLYSVSKTYVSAAVGVAIGEGYFSLDTRVADYFADKCPEVLHPYIRELTVRDCLMMATPFDETPYIHTHEDWLKDFFTAKPTHRGGTLFHYDTGATLVLDALVERATGQPFTEYLYEKVLKYIGYTQVPRCVEAPDGTLWGGSGIFATTRELAAFGLLWKNNGKTEDGKQLIPEWYVKEATTKQMGNREDNTFNGFRGYGYGYQIWITGFGWAMLGMGNQLVFCAPDEDITLVCTGDDQGNDFARNYIVDCMEEYLLKPFKKQTEPCGFNGLAMPVPGCFYTSYIEQKVSGRVYRLQKSQTGIESISFLFENGICTVNFFARGVDKCIRFGMGRYVEGEFPENNYSGNRIQTPMGRGYRCFGAAGWDLDNLLLLKCYAADDYFGQFLLNVRFSEQGIDLHFTKKAEWFFEEYSGFVTGE